MIRLKSPSRFGRFRSEKLIFAILIIASLVPIWSTKYFLTWDGPCHLYNAKILSDYIFSDNVACYDEYYRLNRNLFPNWFSHLSLALLLALFPPFFAEKIFLTTYVVIYPLVFFYLIRVINGKNTFLSFLVFPFIYSNAFQKGFYNFSLSIIILFVLVLFWLKNKDRFSYPKLFIFSILFLVIYFTHPLGYFYSLIILLPLLLTGFLVNWLKRKEDRLDVIKTYQQKGLLILIALLPSLILLFQYLWQRKLAFRAGEQSLGQHISDFIQITSLVALTSQEEIWVIFLSILFGVVLLYSVIFTIKHKNANEYDGFLVAFILSLFIYFNTPDQVAGGFYIKIRLQIFPFLLLLLWLANSEYRKWFKWFIIAGATIITLSLTLIRLPIYFRASEALKEYLSVQGYIAERATVLPLSFSRRGKTAEGEIIADRNQIFRHGLDYIGCGKNLILFDNYEGHMPYFPISWKRSRDPFRWISTNEGITNEPPSADILNYHSKTGGNIDYIVTWCLDKQYLGHPYTRSIVKQLQQGYDLIYASSSGRVILYRRK